MFKGCQKVKQKHEYEAEERACVVNASRATKDKMTIFLQLFLKHREQKLPFVNLIFVLLFLKIQLHSSHFQLFFFQLYLLFVLF